MTNIIKNKIAVNCNQKEIQQMAVGSDVETIGEGSNSAVDPQNLTDSAESHLLKEMPKVDEASNDNGEPTLPPTTPAGEMPLTSESEEDKALSKEEIDKALDKLKSVAIGMGWGKGRDNEKILEYILQTKEIPCVIDADGLNTLSQMNLDILQNTKCKVILTPHLKEFERLSKIPMEEIKRDSIEIAKNFAKKHQVILLLKGSTTIVTDGTTTYLVKRGCPGMATAGSGDVLSGVLVGMLGCHEANPKTIAAGSYLAGMAGELAQEKYTDISMKASDTIEMLPTAIKNIRKGEFYE